MSRRALVAEALGTGLLVCAVVGSGIMADRLTDDVALSLLANTIATGAALFMLIGVFGSVSGAHFNPIVSLVFWLKHEMSASKALGFVAAQCLGGIIGTWVAHGMFELPIVQVSTTIRTGGAQWFSEGIASFGLIIAILGGIAARVNVAATVACYITAAYWFTASTSFANPAVALARALTDTFAGIRPIDLPAFWGAQIIGALMALALGRWLFSTK
jgi:glycerol uptake facilitator-like aquaporin